MKYNTKEAINAIYIKTKLSPPYYAAADRHWVDTDYPNKYRVDNKVTRFNTTCPFFKELPVWVIWGNAGISQGCCAINRTFANRKIGCIFVYKTTEPSLTFN